MIKTTMSSTETRTDDFESQGGVESDARLVEEVRQGNAEAFGTLVRRYEKRLITVLHRFVNDWEAAEDLAQETFLRAYRRLSQFDSSRRFGPWLFRIGVNLTVDQSRQKKRRVWLSFFSENGSHKMTDPAAPDPRPAQDLAQEVQLVLDQISEKYRTVLILRDLENFSTSEIAAIVKRKEATIRWRIIEAREIFQRLWNRRIAERRTFTAQGDDEVPHAKLET